MPIVSFLKVWSKPELRAYCLFTIPSHKPTAAKALLSEANFPQDYTGENLSHATTNSFILT